AFLPVTHSLDRAVHPENLLILGDDLHELASTIVEQDEILENIEQPPLRAYPLQEGFHVDDTRIALFEPLPFAEMLVPAGQRAVSRRDPVAEHNEGIVLEEVRDRVLVVRQIFVIGALKIAIGCFKLYEDERNAIDEPNHIGAAAIERALNP